MKLSKLLETIGVMFASKEVQGEPEIIARLVWRDEEGTPYKVRSAKFGFSSGLRNELTVEMSTQSMEGLRIEDDAVNRRAAR